MNKRRFFFSIIFTLFLFYIDEGYYDLTSFKSLGNWIIFIPYVVVIYLLFTGVTAICKLILKQIQNSN
jgi:hypothetical protein